MTISVVKVAIIGATGYTARETIEILLRHPQAQITYLTALPEECGHITEVFPQLKGRLDLPVEPIDLNKLSQTADVALCCLPHKISMQFVPQLLTAGVKVIDYSADYRLRDALLYQKVYQVEHTDPQNISQAVFGLPELFRAQLGGARLIANPGCYPTAAALALAPLVKEKLIALDDIVVNAVSGATGAGRKATTTFHFPEMNENLFAYAVGTHRHQPEIEQILSDVGGKPVKVLFQPHVVSIDRGIAETIYCHPLSSVNPAQLAELYRQYYDHEPFVRWFKGPPALKNVVQTNFCDLFASVSRGKIVVFSAIDNLVKGAAGQAIQNMNIICKLPETMGLL